MMLVPATFAPAAAGDGSLFFYLRRPPKLAEDALSLWTL